MRFRLYVILLLFLLQANNVVLYIKCIIHCLSMVYDMALRVDMYEYKARNSGPSSSTD